MNQDIEKKETDCIACSQEKESYKKKPMMPIEVPDLPKSTLGFDIITY